MATDPVEQIQRRRYDQPFEPDLSGLLKRLANLPPSTDEPYLTACLNWRPKGTDPNRRAATRFFADQTNELLTKFQARSPEHKAISEAVTRIKEYLDGELSTSVHGAVIVAGGADHVFEPVPLGVSVLNRIAVGPTPALSTVARVREEQADFAVLIAEQDEAVLTVVAQERPKTALEVEASLYPRKQQTGGWSQRRFRARADGRVAAYAKVVAEETRKKLDDSNVSMLVISADEDLMSELNNAFHQTVHERIIGNFRHDPGANESEIIAQAVTIVEETERTRELEAAEAVRDGAAAGGRGVAGPVDVLTALQAGQVMTLVMNEDYNARGWADYSMPLYGTGAPPAQHPAGGDAKQIVEIDLDEEMMRLAVQSDAEIELVKSRPPVVFDDNVSVPKQGEQQRTEAALLLDTMGGVGAVLRFALDAGQSTAEL